MRHLVERSEKILRDILLALLAWVALNLVLQQLFG